MAMKRLPILLADFVDGADIGMVQSGGGLRLAAGSAQAPEGLGDIIGQEFQGDKATESGVLGLVDHAHTAAAELLDDAVVRDGLADQTGACGSPPCHHEDLYVRQVNGSRKATGGGLREI